MKIVFADGGTAGHAFPILAIVRELKKSRPDDDLKLFYIGPKEEYILQLLAKEKVAIKKITCGKLRRYFSFNNFVDIFKIPIGFFQSFFWLFVLAPDIIFSKGGYGSFPVTFAGRILQIPVFLHESDSFPGLSSRVESKWAVEIFTSFPKTEYFKAEKIICTGNPVRQEILNGTPEEAKKIFNLAGGKPIISFLGGSQGAQSINNIVLEILPELLSQFEVIHQTGRNNFEEVRNEADVLMSPATRKFYHPVPFLNENEMKGILAVSQVIISRAGAGAIFEIAACGKPAILIPLPGSAGNHQVKNGYQFAETGGAEVLEEQNLKPHFLLEKIKYLLSREDILKATSQGSADFGRPKAAKVIVDYLLAYLEQT